MIKNGAKLESSDLWYGTALHGAATRGQVNTARTLLQAGEQGDFITIEVGICGNVFAEDSWRSKKKSTAPRKVVESICERIQKYRNNLICLHSSYLEFFAVVLFIVHLITLFCEGGCMNQLFAKGIYYYYSFVVTVKHVVEKALRGRALEDGGWINKRK